MKHSIQRVWLDSIVCRCILKLDCHLLYWICSWTTVFEFLKFSLDRARVGDIRTFALHFIIATRFFSSKRYLYSNTRFAIEQQSNQCTHTIYDRLQQWTINTQTPTRSSLMARDRWCCWYLATIKWWPGDIMMIRGSCTGQQDHILRNHIANENDSVKNRGEQQQQTPNNKQQTNSKEHRTKNKTEAHKRHKQTTTATNKNKNKKSSEPLQPPVENCDRGKYDHW